MDVIICASLDSSRQSSRLALVSVDRWTEDNCGDLYKNLTKILKM
jgi:hypothetical protein